MVGGGPFSNYQITKCHIYPCYELVLPSYDGNVLGLGEIEVGPLNYFLNVMFMRD